MIVRPTFVLLLLLMQAEQRGSIAGKLVDPGLLPIPLAEVSLSGEGVSGTTKTDANGGFVLGSLEDGDYTLRFAMVGFAMRTIGPVKVAGQQRLRFQ